jgi:hypothetical protein
LLIAHYAIITFGLVALFGVCNDPSSALTTLMGCNALLALACFGQLCRFKRNASALSRCHLFLISPTREGRVVVPAALDFIRRANLLLGAPPFIQSVFSVLRDGSSRCAVGAVGSHPFLCPGLSLNRRLS